MEQDSTVSVSSGLFRQSEKSRAQYPRYVPSRRMDVHGHSVLSGTETFRKPSSQCSNQLFLVFAELSITSMVRFNVKYPSRYEKYTPWYGALTIIGTVL